MSYQAYLKANLWKSHWIISDVAACLPPARIFGCQVYSALLAVLLVDALQLQRQAAKPASQRGLRMLCSPTDRTDSTASGLALRLLSQKETAALLSCVLADTLI